MNWGKDLEPDVLVGEVLTHIDVNEQNDEILLTTRSGKQFRLSHDQECCESVNIVGMDGEWKSLLRKKIREVKWEASSEGEAPSEYDESWTRTTITFRVDGATVISRWLGTSNGYYSERVSLQEIAKS